MSSHKDSNISNQLDNRLEDLFGDGSEQAENFENRETEAEVSNQLDTLFGDSDDSTGIAGAHNREMEKPAAKKAPEKVKPPVKKPVAPAPQPQETSPIKDLKSVILSLEWEISEQVMQRLGEEIAILEQKFKDDKIVVAFLQLLGSLGKYIQKKRAEAHPDSISLLNSVYENLEQVIMSEDLTDAAKKKMLVTEVNKYKKLKTNISSRPSVAVAPHKPKAPEKASLTEADHGQESVIQPEISGEAFHPAASSETTPPMDIPSAQQLAYILQDIHQTIKTELRALREEIRSWKNA